MLKEFWDHQKHIIQLAGIFTGVGALFLGIPMPIDEGARQALINLQFVWFLIISASCLLLLFSLLRLSVETERRTKDKWGLDFDRAISSFFILVILWFLYNLWRYLFSIYKDPLISIIRIANTTVGTIFVGAIFFIHGKIRRFVYKKRLRYYRLFDTAMTAALAGLLVGLWGSLYRLEFTFTLFGRVSIVAFPVCFLLITALDFYSSRKNKEPWLYPESRNIG